MDSPIRFGIIGTNFISDWLLEAAREEPRFLANAVCSRNLETGNAFATKHGIHHVFTSPEEMANSPLIDAVYIASPNSLHARLSILFMEQGKHVLCEKPLASNAREVQEMQKVSRNTGKTLMEAMKSTLTPNFQIVQKQLGQLGTVRRYFSCYGQYSSRYNQLKEGIILNAFKPELSNGAMMDLGIYTIYPMVVLFGRPRKISATGLKLFTGVDGQGAINFEYPDMNATILYSKITDSYLPTEIQGEKGTLILDRIHTIKQIQLIPKGKPAEQIAVPPSHNEYYYEIREFINLIENKQIESLTNSHLHSLITMEIMDEARKQLGVLYPADKASI